MARLGMTIPVNGLALRDQPEISRSLENLGFTDLWSSEAMAADAFTPLTLAASATSSARLGTAIASVYARGPVCLAQTSASLAMFAPNRVAIGIGSSSKLIVEDWMDRSFNRPVQRTLDTVNFLRSAFAGERIDREYDTFSVRGFRLGSFQNRLQEFMSPRSNAKCSQWQASAPTAQFLTGFRLRTSPWWRRSCEQEALTRKLLLEYSSPRQKIQCSHGLWGADSLPRI